MTTKLMTEASLWEAKEQLEAIKAQMEASSLSLGIGGTGGGGGDFFFFY